VTGVSGRYPTGMALRQVTNQVALLVAFMTGGVLSAALGPRACLAVDAVTFAVSALAIGAFVGEAVRGVAEVRP
jgi:hypothetical protein